MESEGQSKFDKTDLEHQDGILLCIYQGDFFPQKNAVGALYVEFSRKKRLKVVFEKQR